MQCPEAGGCSLLEGQQRAGCAVMGRVGIQGHIQEGRVGFSLSEMENHGTTVRRGIIASNKQQISYIQTSSIPREH